MRNILLILLTVCCIGIVNSAVYAKTNRHHHIKETNKAIVVLYAKPTTKAHVIAKINPLENLIPIYQKGEWVKVGNSENGQVGWVNIEQYRSVIKALDKAKVRTLYMQYISSNKGGKPDLIVYENGKRVSKKRAKQIYKRMRYQEVKEERQFQRFQSEIQEMQMRMNKQMNKMFEYFGPINQRHFCSTTRFPTTIIMQDNTMESRK